MACSDRQLVHQYRFVSFFFFKQKTAYEMRISDWSSDVCSSDLVAIVTTDFAGVTRGRSVAVDRLDAVLAAGVGWLPANLSLTPFDGIATPNPWGSRGDLRILPEPGARYHSEATGSATPFDMMLGDGAVGQAARRERVCQAV